MSIERFEDLESWREARELVKAVYGALAPCKDYGFRDQIQRAAVSIMSNIAEAFGRGSARECIQFFVVARGSLAEVRSLCYIALDIGYFDQDRFSEFCGRCDRIKALINGFIRHMRRPQSSYRRPAT